MRPDPTSKKRILVIGGMNMDILGTPKGHFQPRDSVMGHVLMTPGGVGLREAVTAALFTAFKAQPAAVVATIPIVNTLIATVWTLVGAAAWIFKANPIPARPEEARTPPPA